MLGKILLYSKEYGNGIVQDPNGDVYLFDSDSVSDDCVPYEGMSAYFELTHNGRVRSEVSKLTRAPLRFNWSPVIIAFFALALSACAAPKGDTGSPGVNGEDGSSLEPIEQDLPKLGDIEQDLANEGVIELCPNKNKHFPKHAICISNKLYAIVDGSLLELVPGTRLCNFAIHPNCRIR